MNKVYLTSSVMDKMIKYALTMSILPSSNYLGAENCSNFPDIFQTVHYTETAT